MFSLDEKRNAVSKRQSFYQQIFTNMLKPFLVFFLSRKVPSCLINKEVLL